MQSGQHPFPLHAVAPLTEKDYYVRGCTALLDAIGYGVEKMVNIQRHLPADERAEKVIFVITTDGLENASKRFGYEKIRRMIEREKEQYGWEFLFLGANMDAVKEAARFGISSDRAVRFENDAQGVAVNYHVVSETVSRMRQADCPTSIGAEWKEKIEADFKKRHQGERGKQRHPCRSLLRDAAGIAAGNLEAFAGGSAGSV